MFLLDSEPPASVLEALAHNRYGYSFVDVGLTPADLFALDQIQIGVNRDYNQFGGRANWEEEIAHFLAEIGPNQPPLIEQVAKRVAQIADEVMTASGRPTGWICLRAGVPNTQFDQPRWHMDGHYYSVKARSIQYKFALTLIGASTLFYPIPKDYISLRRIIWMHMGSRSFMSELCQPDKATSAVRGQGAYFTAGDYRIAAIHSEPPIHENRLFFSIVPCEEDELETLKGKVMTFYKTKTNVYDP